ncbi:MAG: hypothetical protein R2911_36615 [Caldilineaceae bacterium]
MMARFYEDDSIEVSQNRSGKSNWLFNGFAYFNPAVDQIRNEINTFKEIGQKGEDIGTYSKHLRKVMNSQYNWRINLP